MGDLEIIFMVWFVDGGITSLDRDGLGRHLLDVEEKIFIAHRPNGIHDLRMPEEIVVLGKLFSDRNEKGGGDVVELEEEEFTISGCFRGLTLLLCKLNG
jgi:hypothetical protein